MQKQETHGLTSINFNTENTAKGSAYEKLVEEDLLTRNYSDIMPALHSKATQIHPTQIYSRGHRICSVDFYAKNPEGVIEYIEAKGGETDKKNNQKKVTAGARRCDNVKKALWNGWEVKHRFDAVRRVFLLVLKIY